MKRTLTTLASALMLAAPAWAVDEHHPEGQAGAAPPPEKTVEQMRENATKMQVQLDRIAQAKTAEERQKLLMEHMQTMRENMMMGQQMAMGDMNCPMMDSMSGGSGMMGRGGMMMMGPGGEHEAMVSRMQQMERRMEMMERQIGQHGGPAAPAR